MTDTALAPRGLTWCQLTVGGLPARVGEIHWGDNLTVAFVHGFGSSPAFANRRAIEELGNTPVLKELGARLIAPVLPAFGAMPPLKRHNFTLDDYADWYLDVMRTMRITGPVLLFGESMGGAIAAIAAAKQVADVRALLTFNSVGGRSEHRSRRQWVQAILSMSAPQRGNTDQWLASATDAALTLGRFGANWRISSQLMHADLRPVFAKLKKIGVPTVAVFSRDDPLVVPSSSETFRQALGITPLFIPGDHRSFLERHPAVALLINDLASAIVNGEPISRNPAERLGADVLEANGITTLLQQRNGRLHRARRPSWRRP